MPIVATESLRNPSDGRIDRARPIEFTFNGTRYRGFAGDTLASALLANDVRLTGRSFKYHRPRGIVGIGFEESGTTVQLSGTEDAPNMPVTRARLYEGLVASTVNCWPSPAFDVGAIIQAFSRLLPAGFYYKTFIWPNWRLFEPLIRRAAGLGRAPSRAESGLNYETRHAHCDVLVTGGGPTGLMAALVAGKAGARVLLVDDDVEPGGRLLVESARIGGRDAMAWVASVVAELDAMDNVIRLADATAWGYREHNLVIVTERRPKARHLFQRTWRVRASSVIVASGAIERPLVFADNDRPGVMLASAAAGYVNRYAVRPGRRAVVFTNNDSAYRAARDLAAGGVEIAAIVDSRTEVRASVRALCDGIEVLSGHVVATVTGGRCVRSVGIARRAGGGRMREVACDLLCVAGGWNPAVHLFSQSRGTVRYDDALATFVPDRPAQPTIPAGAACGKFDLAACIDDGMRAGAAAAAAAGFEAQPISVPEVPPDAGYSIEPLWAVAPRKPGAKAFVDIQNDVTLDDLHLAIREGFGAVEHAKRYTTAGMGIDQGKTGNVNVIGALADHLGVMPNEVGTTTFRSPYTPIEFGAIAGYRPGPLFLPYRHTPMTGWHKARGALMYEAGARWRRPGYYPLPSETMQQAVDRECRASREGAGIYDGSPLGKFEIKGPDALRLLEFVYTNSFANLQERQGRYGIMLTDDGVIFDDGVTFKLAEGRYLMTTSTGNADVVYRKLEEFLQIERPEWSVHITPVTSQWANATVCGPRAREVLREAGTDIDLDRDAFPFLHLREGIVAGLPARVCRVSFTGELSFEVNVRRSQGLLLWERLMAAGTRHGITPVGSEGSHVLRVEKGFLSLGHEADGTADPIDLGMEWIVSKTKPDFIGKRALAIRRAAGTRRRELVGLLFDEPNRFVIEGSPITPGGRKEKTEGFVSACVWSVVHNRIVALGLIEAGRSRHGEKAFVRMKDEVVAAMIVAPVFHDPDGARMKG